MSMQDPLEMAEFPKELFVVCTSEKLYCVHSGGDLFLAVFIQRDDADVCGRLARKRFRKRLLTAAVKFDVARGMVKDHMKGVMGLMLMDGKKDLRTHWVK